MSDEFESLFGITPATRAELYTKGEPRLLAKLKVQDRQRFEQLMTLYRERHIPDLTSLSRDVNRVIKAAERKAAAKKVSADGLDEFDLNEKTGAPKPTQGNIRIAIEKLGVTLRHNEFSGTPIIEGLSTKFNGPLQDHAIAELWLIIDDQFGFRPRMDFFTTVLINISRRNSFHPIIDYFESLVWDGTPRIGSWLVDYCHAEDTPFNREVGRLYLLAGVRRIKSPGEKFDTMLILEGPEGNNKSGVFAALAIKPEYFSDSIKFSDDDKQMIEKAAGKWIIEIADMQGMTKTDYNRIKAQLSRQTDRARLAYARLATEVKRQFITAGTTNQYEYLASMTGNRRSWCVRTTEWICLETFRPIVPQLWAEAIVQEADQPDLFLPRELWEGARIVQAEREVENAFTDKLGELIGYEDGYVFASDLLEALEIPVGRAENREHQKLGHAMKALGFEKKRRTRNKIRALCYERGSTEDVTKQIRFKYNSDNKKWSVDHSWGKVTDSDEEFDEYDGPFVDEISDDDIDPSAD